MCLKTDSFVVESNVHFPSDYGLLWDSCRKMIELSGRLAQQTHIPGFRKIFDWWKRLKNGFKSISQHKNRGGKGAEILKEKINSFLTTARDLVQKIKETDFVYFTETQLKKLIELEKFTAYADKHIDLVERRIIKGEEIPHHEKMFSVFETYTQWISKGKKRAPVELGKKLAISTDQHQMIRHFKVMDLSDSQEFIGICDAVLAKTSLKISSWSTDKGFYSAENKALLQLEVPLVVMPKKGKRNQEETQYESNPEFKRLKNKHSAVESNINSLEHRGLDRCPDRGEKHYKRYIGIGICAYNLNVIGAEFFRQEKEAQKHKRKRKLIKESLQAA